MKIKKAIVAVAGSGTRFLPATKSQPKEMLPIVDKPIIQYLVEELVAAGIEDIIMVTRWDKKPLEDHFDRSFELEYGLEQAGKTRALEQVRKISSMANFIYVRQKQQYGNGVPILSAQTLVKDEPFVFAFGDDLVKSQTPFTKQLVRSYEKHQCPIIGVQKVPKDQVDRYGIVKLKLGTKEIADLVEKPNIKRAPSQLAQFGRMILTQEIVDELADTPVGKGNELWITDAVKTYVKKGGKVMVREVQGGEWMTTGDPLNYLKATVEYAMDRKDLAADFSDYIKKRLC
ncbi:MAG: UTP--glucose-1-phosphate uridylyltransferase [Candidatus Pacebacteria bacterium]|nr:UTP--glucose-1-phosphate uridylyltransferase [Candidatus Paceibacterota bacterium]